MEKKKLISKRKLIVFVIIIFVLITTVLLVSKLFIPMSKYKNGERAFENGDFEASEKFFLEAGEYKDAADKAIIASNAGHYMKAEEYFKLEKYSEAVEEYELANGYLDAQEKSINADRAYHYEKAEQFLKNENYSDALKEYQLAIGYKDAENKAEETNKAYHYQKAEEFLKEEYYLQAIEEYELSLGYDNSKDRIKECYYYAGIAKMNAAEYEDAIAFFENADNYEDSNQKLIESNYLYGKKLFVNKSFTKSEKYLEAAGDYEIAKGLLNAAKGEEYLHSNNISKALEFYNKVPSNCTIEGYDIQGRKNNLNKLKVFSDICGTWKATSNYISVKNIWNYDGRWDSWYIDETIPSQSLTIKCVVNNDNTVTVTGKVYFYVYNNYSSLKVYCQASSTSRSFEWKNVTSIPRSTNIDNDTTLTYSNGVFKISYSKTDNYSVNFHNVYSSTVTYGKKE